MGPKESHRYLDKLIAHKVQHAVMMWGKPVIGKLSIVRQLAESRKIGFVDAR